MNNINWEAARLLVTCPICNAPPKTECSYPKSLRYIPPIPHLDRLVKAREEFIRHDSCIPKSI